MLHPGLVNNSSSYFAFLIHLLKSRMSRLLAGVDIAKTVEVLDVNFCCKIYNNMCFSQMLLDKNLLFGSARRISTRSTDDTTVICVGVQHY